MGVSPTQYTRFDGWWCDNCRTAYSWRPNSGNCPDCGAAGLRPARVTVEPTDLDTDTARQAPDHTEEKP